VPMLVVLAACGGTEKPATPVAAALQTAQADLRKVVHTAEMKVRVGDADAAAEDAARVATEAGGVVFARMSLGREARLTLKVPPERFEPVIGALGDLGQALKRESRAKDVTDQVVDVEGRLRTSLASADRLRALLGDARSTGEIVGIEAELAKRETEIESLQGRLRVLSSQVDLATIDLRLTERADASLPAFTAALRAGWDAFLLAVRAGAAASGFLLPFAPLFLAGWWVVRRRLAA
jgi:Domain of unknown function (DUF4349)